MSHHATITSEDADTIIRESREDAHDGKMCGLEINNPKFMGIASHQLKSILVDALEKGKELDQIINLLSCTRDSDTCFDFRVGRNMDDKVIALCWQDGVMRGHCKAGLLDVVMLDMMKRQQNTVDWPYCGPVLITGENKVACACEAIVLSESQDTYVWIMNSVYEMSGVSPKQTKVIFGDGVQSMKLLERLGIEKTCALILDRYHLLQVDWPKKFGYHWCKISTFMKDLVYATSESEYDDAFEKGRQSTKSSDLQKYLVSLPHTPQGLSPIGSNRHCVVGRDPRAPANKNENN